MTNEIYYKTATISVAICRFWPQSQNPLHWPATEQHLSGRRSRCEYSY